MPVQRSQYFCGASCYRNITANLMMYGAKRWVEIGLCFEILVERGFQNINCPNLKTECYTALRSLPIVGETDGEWEIEPTHSPFVWDDSIHYCSVLGCSVSGCSASWLCRARLHRCACPERSHCFDYDCCRLVDFLCCVESADAKSNGGIGEVTRSPQRR